MLRVVLPELTHVCEFVVALWRIMTYPAKWSL